MLACDVSHYPCSYENILLKKQIHSHTCYVSSIMLLLSICHHLLRGSIPVDIWDDLCIVQSNCEMLCYVSEYSNLASFFLQVLSPLYHQSKHFFEGGKAIKNEWDEFQIRVNPAFNDETEFHPQAVVSLMEQLIHISRVPDIIP